MLVNVNGLSPGLYERVWNLAVRLRDRHDEGVVVVGFARPGLAGPCGPTFASKQLAI